MEKEPQPIADVLPFRRPQRREEPSSEPRTIHEMSDAELRLRRYQLLEQKQDIELELYQVEWEFSTRPEPEGPAS